MKYFIIPLLLLFYGCTSTPIAVTPPVHFIPPPSPASISLPSFQFDAKSCNGTFVFTMSQNDVYALLTGLNSTADYIEQKNAELWVYKQFIEKLSSPSEK